MSDGSNEFPQRRARTRAKNLSGDRGAAKSTVPSTLRNKAG